MSKQEKKNLVPVLRFSEFRNTETWKIKSFSQMFEIGSGKDYKHLASGDIPVYGSGGYMLSVNDYLYDGESVCIGRKGTINNPMFLNEKFWTVDTLFYTHSFKDCIPKFVFSLFQNINWLKYNEAGGVPSLSKVIINKIEVGVPPTTNEQQKIADCLSSIDELINAQIQKFEELKAHKKGLMQQLFPTEDEAIPKLRFPEFRNQKDWKPRKLFEFIFERNQLPEKKLPLYSLTIEDGIVPKTERYERSFLVKDITEAYKLVKTLDFAYNPMNLRFGAIAMHSGDEDVAISKYYNVFYCNNTVDSKFCEIYFQSPTMIKHYNDVATGSLIEKKRVHFSDFLTFNIQFPLLKEQQKIADCLSSLDELIGTQSQKIEALKLHKKGLTQQLLPVMDEVET